MKSHRRMPILAILGALVLCAIPGGTPPAQACGGPDYGDLGALGPLDGMLGRLQWRDLDYDYSRRDELRFLYPFYREDPAAIAALWQLSYEHSQKLPKPSPDAFEQAVRAGDLAGAKRAAEGLIAAIYAMPPVAAADHLETLWRAVELIELFPHLPGASPEALNALFLDEPLPPAQALSPLLRAALSGRDAQHRPAAALPPGHPRRPTADLLALQADFRRRIPNGWSHGIRRQVPAGTWRALERDVDLWLAANQQHPLLDLGRLWKVRICYFAGRSADAWQLLFDLYPHRPVRALAEMRYLLLQDVRPGAAQLQALQDPVLITAFTDGSTLTPASWTKRWQLALTAPSRPWSINLQERLLLWAAQQKTGLLPPGFPAQPQNPSVLWGKLRAIALMKAQHYSAAARQLSSLQADPEQARLTAKLRLLRGDPALAAQTPLLYDDARSYILGVLVPTKALPQVARSATPQARTAGLGEQALRLAAQGKWQQGANIIAPFDPARASLWRQAAQLRAATDRAGRLRFARFLRDHHGQLLAPGDTGWYRGVSVRYADLRRARQAAEAGQIEDHMTRASERWLALGVYADWLDSFPRDTAARDVLREADGVYNQLINWGGGDYFFWGSYAPQTSVVKKLRRIGKTIRSPSP